MAPRDLDKRIRLPPAGTAFRRRLYTSTRLSDKGSFRRRFDATQAVMIHRTLRARLTFPLGPVRLSCTARLSAPGYWPCVVSSRRVPREARGMMLLAISMPVGSLLMAFSCRRSSDSSESMRTTRASTNVSSSHPEERR